MRCLAPIWFKHPLQEHVDEEPGAHVARLFLAPDHLGLLEARQLGDQRLGRERIELLDAQQIDVVDAALLALLVKIEIDLAGAHDDAADLVVGHELDRLVRQQLRVVPQQAVERGAGRHFVEPRDRALVAQQAFRRHQDQRLADFALQLPAQGVEIIRRRREVRHLHVVFGAHLQEALEPRGGMFRPLAFVAMRQQAHEARHAQPLAFARRNELVEHHLRAIGEIAELRFPQRQRIRLGGRIAVFEAEHGLFRQARVEHLVARLAFAQMVERRVALLGLLIEQHRMALREGAALAVLPGQPHRMAFLEQRAEGERFGRRPVDALAGLDRLGAMIEKALDGLVDVEALRHRRDLLADLAQLGERDAGIAAARIVGFARRLQARPAAVEPIGLVRLVAAAPASNSASRRARQSAFIFSTSPSVTTPSAISLLP